MAAMLISTKKYKKIRKWICVLLVVCCLVSPVVFNYASTIRGAGNTSGTELFDKIIGRCSYLDTVGAPLYQKDYDVWNKELFEQKYSISNQLAQSINSILPGDVFESDVFPNQYFRAVFMEYDLETVQRYYTSINISFPGYLYLKYDDAFLAVAIPFALIMICYIFCIALEKHPLIWLLIGKVLLDSVLNFFDLPMIFQDIKIYAIIVGLFYLFYWIIRSFPYI